MRPVSAAFTRAVAHAHVVATRASVSLGGVVLAENLPVSGGEVVMDAAGAVRRTLSCTVPGAEWMPTYADDPLAPYGQEITVERGIVSPLGVTEWVQLGVFRIESVETSLLGNEVSLTGSDRMAAMVESLFGYPFPARNYGPRVVQSMLYLIRRAYPEVVFRNELGDNREVGKGVLYEEDYGSALVSMATGLGGEVFANALGEFVLREVPDVSEPVLTIAAGPGGILVDVSGGLSRETVHNGVVARGEPVDGGAIVTGYAFDLDPKSPTRWRGPFGLKPMIYASPLLTTKDQATKAAQTLLRTALGNSRALDLSAVPHPALEPGDTIELVYPTGGRDRHVVEAVTIPLGLEGEMTARTRTTSYVVPAGPGIMPVPAEWSAARTESPERASRVVS